jgi:alkylation response protein AidB-like acyl-CoA dehydrogenase
MAIAISADEIELGKIARSFMQSHGGLQDFRRQLNSDACELPNFWDDMASLGWQGLALAEEVGGQGASLVELVVILEELGRCVSGGALLTTTWASSTIASSQNSSGCTDVLQALASGSAVGSVGLGGSLTHSNGQVSGDAGLVAGASIAQFLVLRLGDDMVIVDSNDSGVKISGTTSFDPSLRLARVTLDNVSVDKNRILTGAFRGALSIGRLLVAAEATGVAAAVTEMSTAYVKVREQFGRPVGTFQAVKHHAANMLINTELATAAVWDAASNSADEYAALTASVAASTALEAAVKNAELCIQLHGGIGFTWEHDAHLFLRHARALSTIAGTIGAAQDNIYESVKVGNLRAATIALPPEAEQYRTSAREVARMIRETPESQRREKLATSGYLVPHWPKPYGLGAGAVEQLVIAQEFADVHVPDLSISGWVTLTILQMGSNDQIDRWIHKSLIDEDNWCQLFSEPNAGSDAAAIQTRATKVEGGWKINGQKVWTSGAATATMGMGTVRTDPDAQKHAGVTMVAINMTAPGVTIRPLKQINGGSHFCEVFFDDVFISDADVIGEVNGGWLVARATLGNERVSIGGNIDMGNRATDLLALLEKHPVDHAVFSRQTGRLLGIEEALSAMNRRQAVRAVAGGAPGPEGNITKIVQAETQQRVAELGMDIASAAGLMSEDELIYSYFQARCSTIAGGTSEISRNVIAERLLGLPRDPLAK